MARSTRAPFSDNAVTPHSCCRPVPPEALGLGLGYPNAEAA